MNHFNIINRYIFRELIPPFSISLFFLTFVFLMTRIPEIMNMVVNYDIRILSVALMLVYTLPRFLEFTIPMSVMLSVLLIFIRMSRENEIIALKGAGTSVYSLLPPVLVFCFLGTLLTMGVTVFGVSWGKLSFKEKGLEIASANMDLAFEERQFNSKIEDIMIYISHVDFKTKELKDIFIADGRTENITAVYIAPRGKLIFDKEKMISTIRLYDGIINQADPGRSSVNLIRYERYDINIDLLAAGKKIARISKDLDEMSLSDLVNLIRSGLESKTRLNAALMELHEKFSIPFACFSLGILAFSLGIQSMFLNRTSGLGLGVFFFFLYYCLLAAGWSVGETEYCPPAASMWIPTVIMGGIGIFLLVRSAEEKPLRLPETIQRKLLSTLKYFLKKE